MDLLTDDEARSRCARLSGLLAERATDAEELRRLPAATIADVTDDGLWALVVPTSLGGHGLGIGTLANCTRILAHGCPASAWTISFLVMHNFLLARFPQDARMELFRPDRPYVLAPAPLAPTGTIERVDGGFRLHGRWEWATGISHADWVMVHAVELGPEPTTRFVLVPIGDVAVDDVWFTSGMRATGSNVVRADGVFVPERRTVAPSALRIPASPLSGDGMAGLPMTPVLALVAAAPALGAAEAALELFRQRIADRVLAYSLGDQQRDQPAAQIRLATAASELASAQARWHGAVADLERLAGGELTDLQRVGFRLSAAATVRAARAVISIVCEGAGASVYFTDSPLQRLQRDIEVLKGHVIFDWDRTTELAGRVMLGVPLRPTDMA